MQYIGVLLILAMIAAAAVMILSPTFKGYRTLIVGWLTAGIGGALPLATQIFGYLQDLDWRQYVLSGDNKNLTLLAIVGGLGIIMVVLRYMTTGAVGEKT
jgi:MFS family permease